MKRAACFSFAVAIVVSSHALAAVEQCRFIQAKPEREACYQRQELARSAKQQARDASQQKSVDPTEPQNDRLAKSLRSICRGC
jgi:hypothetical protein